MQSGDDPVRGKPAPTSGGDGLFSCRMSMLGLDPREIASRDGEALNKIRQCCARCGDIEACTIDLKRDPNSPVWETYCPNFETFSALTEPLWKTR